MNNIEYEFLQMAQTLWKAKDSRLLEHTEEIDDINISIRSRKLVHLWRGKYFFSMGEYDSAEIELKKVDNSWYNYLFPQVGNIYEEGVYRFHFVGSNEMRKKQRFIQVYLKNYDRISAMIRPRLYNKKIDVYIYDAINDSLGNSLCYADMYLQTINTNIDIKGGHELIHILLGNTFGEKNIVDFLNEGLATWLDIEDMSWFRFVHKQCGCYISAANIEKYMNSKERTREYYYIAGLTVGYLYQDKEKFDCLLRCSKTGNISQLTKSIYSLKIIQEIEEYYCKKGY